MWLEKVPVVPASGTRERYARAAYLSAGSPRSPRVVELRRGRRAPVHDPHLPRRPARAPGAARSLRDDGVWRHPLVAGAFDDELRERLLARGRPAPAYVDELLALPRVAAHGDACPNNLLVVDGYDGFVLIDFGF